MDSYSPLLDRIRVPQPSLQKLAVISIFQKLRSSPPHLNPDSNPGRDAISQCLHSNSSPVVDQSVRELCRLVKDGTLDISRGLLELQSSLEGSNPRFVDLFIKGIGFLVRLAFQKNNNLGFDFDVDVTNSHPFVRVLACRIEVQSELTQQVLLFVAQYRENREMGLDQMLKFLTPFLSFSILRIPFSPNSNSGLFARHLVSSIATLSCSFPSEAAVSIIKWLTGFLKYFPSKNEDDFKDVFYVVESLVDAYIVVLKHAVDTGSLTDRVQSCGMELVETILSFCTDLDKPFDGKEAIIELSKRVLLVQKQLGIRYFPDLSSVLTSMFIVLCRTEFEHQQLSIMKLSLSLLKWERENESIGGRTACSLPKELLFIFPVINLLSSPSGSVKAAATDMLSVLEKILKDFLIARKEVSVIQRVNPSVSTPESIICRLWQRLCFQEHSSFYNSYFLALGYNSEVKSWASHLRNFCLLNVERKKMLTVSQRQESISIEMSVLLSSVVNGLVMHQSLGSHAVECLSAIGIMDPKLGLPQLLCVLFYSKLLCNYENSSDDMLLKLLKMLPSVASHSAMVPLIVQTILPMLNRDAKPVMRATATRLLCSTWEVTDRVFGTLQGTLHPTAFKEFLYEKDICISMAASIRDVCRKNPDRGVDLILSVSACIESPVATVQALGLQSLEYLCEADVVDFYTAWSVIAKFVSDYSKDPVVAHGLSILLRWGAMDAEAYSEASKTVLEILWGVGTSKNSGESKWVKAQCSAFESLTQYEVEHIQRSIPDFRTRNMQFLISEENLDVLNAIEEFEVKIIKFQHSTRRRVLKEKTIPVNKVEKLLEGFPQAVFNSDFSYAGNNSSSARSLPGAALLCLNFTPKDVQREGTSKELPKVNAVYESALVDIAESLQLSRNILVAMLSLQSWKPFMQHWMNAVVMLLDAKAKSSASDTTSKAASNIFKIMKRVAEESIPRCAENIALAVGALCTVLPPSVHTVTSMISKFLLEWLFQFEHEHRQWSAAITLGYISSCLHITDHKQKSDIITGLLKVACSSKSTLVKGACGIGLGFSCQDLQTSIEAADSSNADETSRERNIHLVGRIVRVLSMIISQLNPSSSGSLQRLCEYFPLNKDNLVTDATFNAPDDRVNIEEDVWGVAGLILGLGSSASTIYRVAGQDAVVTLKALLMSWIPKVSTVDRNNSVCKPETMLTVGSCLALPLVMEFCLRVELVNGDELNHMINGFRELISELLSVNKTGTSHQSLLIVSCIGAGSLLSCILEEGVHPVKSEEVEQLLELFSKCYTHQYPPSVHFGGMLGVVNALGAGAGILTLKSSKSSSFQTAYGQKDSSYIRGPILLAPACEQLAESLVQQMFIGARDSKDQQLQMCAAWAVSFLRQRWLFKESRVVKNSSVHDTSNSKPASQTFPEDSVVSQLCSWLQELSYIEGKIIHVNTVATVLRCLSQAPRLPSLDWGAIIRRCMRYEDQVSINPSTDHVFTKGSLREECIMFALAQADHVNPLLSFLDELTDISRFRTLELNLQTCLLSHLVNFTRIFSTSRLEKLFDNLANYFSVSSYDIYDPKEKCLLRVSFWKGLHNCFEETTNEPLQNLTNTKKCMELLFATLPALHADASSMIDHANFTKEWSEAISCIGKAPQTWLVDLLEIPDMGIVRGGIYSHGVLKKIQARVRLVMNHSIPMRELRNLRANILHNKTEDIWDVLVDILSVLQDAEGSFKRQWLVDAVEMSCITSYPSTAMRFLGLLAGSWCKYMPLLVLDPVTVLSDLPVTLPSLFSDNDWMLIVEPVVLNLWRSTERIFSWAKSLESGSDYASDQQQIDESESTDAVFLACVMHNTCISLKDYLPFEQQLKLANMEVL